MVNSLLDRTGVALCCSFDQGIALVIQSSGRRNNAIFNRTQGVASYLTAL